MPLEVPIAEGQTPPQTHSLLSSAKTVYLNYPWGGMMSGVRHCGVLVMFGTTLCRSGWKPAANDATGE